jgi:hypothetical protein
MAAVAAVLAMAGLGVGVAKAQPSTHASRPSSVALRTPCHTPAGHTTPVCSTQEAQDQVTTLMGTLSDWQANYATFSRSHPGPLDILDYDIATLREEGIDGSGTTVAVIEGWDDANIGAAMASFDAKYDLPPAGGLARLDALVEGVRRAGVPVTVTIEGQPRPLPAVTDLSAFRIIQEALTNTVRHAGPAKATVAVRYGPGDLRIEVTDDGRIGPARGVAERAATGPAPAAVPVPPAGRSADPGLSSAQAAASGPLGVRSSGHGLRGMRERAAVAGGTIQIGPAPSGGFRVVAWFPGQPDASQVPIPAQEPPATQETGGDQ